MPLTISFSMDRDQSTAPRLKRKVLETTGHSLRRIITFHLFDLILVIIAICASQATDERAHSGFCGQKLEVNLTYNPL
jgi:hypothetical protein